MTDYPNTPKRTNTEQGVDHTHPNTDPSDAYPPNTTGKSSNWLWVVPLMLVTLIVGLMAGKLWGEKQATEQRLSEGQLNNSQSGDAEKPIPTPMATAVGVTEVQTQVTPAKPVLTVETVTPQKSVVEDTLSADGTVSPKTTATVNGKVSGVTIDQVLVQEGDRVNKGQVLAVFDTDAMSQQLIQAQAELAEAQTSFEVARKNYERVAPLLEINAVSEQEVDGYKAKADQAAAAMAASKARLNNQNLNMENAKVTAPVAGIISEKTANVGSVPGPEPLFTIIENGQLEWQAQVDPNKVGEINVGTPVIVSLPNNQSVPGRVSRIAPTTEKGSRQITIYATLASHPNLRAGMYQRGTFDLGRDAKVTIPYSAVVTQDGYDYVMQVKSEKNEKRETIYRISRVKVKLGERTGDRVVLLEPLKGDGKIVRQGGGFLNDGDIVRIAETTP